MELNGIPTAQLEGQIDLFHSVIDTFKVKLFVELGAFMGGLTYELSQKHPEMKLLSFDLGGYVHEKARDLVQIKDVFAPGTVEYVREQIEATDGVAMIFCDNGDKIAEFNLYVDLLRPGDLIQVHDYPTEFTFEALDDVRRNHRELVPVNYQTYLNNKTVLWVKI